MRILHVGESLDPQLGGPSVSAPSQALAQATRGDHVTYLYYRAASQASGAIPTHLASLPGAHLVDFMPLPLPHSLEKISAIGARRWLRANIRQFDVVHLHGVWRPVLAAAAMTAARNGIPYLLQPHGMLDVWSMQQKALKKKLAWWLVWRRIAGRAAFVHVLNEQEAEGFRQCGLPTPLAIVANGVFRKQLDDIEHASGETMDAPPYILFMARLHKKKGLDVLAEAYRIYRQKGGQARLRIVGPDEGARDTFEKDIRRADLVDHIDICEPAYGAAKYPLMHNARCFCLPSYQEGFSMALLEAAACGTPLVISTECHFPEVAEHDAGVVLPLEAHAFADALIDLTAPENEISRQQTGRNARNLVRDRFTWESIAEQLEGYYRAAQPAGNKLARATQPL